MEDTFLHIYGRYKYILVDLVHKTLLEPHTHTHIYTYILMYVNWPLQLNTVYRLILTAKVTPP